jgi:hypothetical protein
MSMMWYVVKFRIDMALLALPEGEAYFAAFYKYDPRGGGRQDRSVTPQSVLITLSIETSGSSFALRSG